MDFKEDIIEGEKDSESIQVRKNYKQTTNDDHDGPRQKKHRKQKHTLEYTIYLIEEQIGYVKELCKEQKVKINRLEERQKKLEVMISELRSGQYSMSQNYYNNSGSPEATRRNRVFSRCVHDERVLTKVRIPTVPSQRSTSIYMNVDNTNDKSTEITESTNPAPFLEQSCDDVENANVIAAENLLSLTDSQWE